MLEEVAKSRRKMEMRKRPKHCADGKRSLLAFAVGLKKPWPSRVHSQFILVVHPELGKLQTLRRVCEYFGRQTTFSFLNCASVTSQTKLIEGILNALESHARPTLTALTTVLKGLRKHFVLILDEIDHLTSNTNTFLYAAFQWPQTITNKLIVIGVANSIDLTERLLPKLRLGQPPETLVFAPYTKDDITQIIKSKIANESEGCMDGAAVELCSRKVAAMTGDLRTALHVMKQTTDAHEPSTPRGCREVLGVLNGVFSSPLARARLPLQPRLLLAVAVVLSSNRKKALDVVSLTNAYHRACDVVKVPRLEGEDLDAALQILESQSFIARAPSGKLLLQVNAATAKLAIADNQMIAQVTGLNL
uniref:ATPase_AAA_core domain-containing protein n=1 Tax=Haemonchus contortus TaxID=6289 RepID=A0A7I5E608_HAECO